MTGTEERTSSPMDDLEWPGLVQWPWSWWEDLEEMSIVSNAAFVLWALASPLLLVFVLPLFILLFLYLSTLFLYLYGIKNIVRSSRSAGIWSKARRILASLWVKHAAFWHGYEVHGLENVPDSGPALIVYYHGAIPIDYYYLLSSIILSKGRLCYSVADHFLFKLPGFRLLLEVFRVIHGPREQCVRVLRRGHLLAISPGGLREALFSDNAYRLLWGNRSGFAQVAIDAKAPIIPVFTQNLREGFRTLGSLCVFRWLYERCRLPVVPIYGGFPVKFRTYLGDPIPYDPGTGAAELAEKTKQAMQGLIEEHQDIPGNILLALAERLSGTPKVD
ncbi:monoacylglycerol/Diacylglycerol O-acyltransferase isoform X3 [Lethenteron reissneri]|nr:monoacylglycerol/Diacylglycerol O-acyltransferase isoform X3 [Lethenteron reissneri]